MPLDDDLEYLIAATGHERYRDLVDPTNPSYDPAWEEVVRKESARIRGETGGRELPSHLRMAGNALSALGRAVSAVAQGEPLRVPAEERDRRLATCEGCDRYDNGRCLACGCYLKAKTTLATEKCPLGKW